MRISVIIPTFNGADKISGIINALKEQWHQPDEVIVIIDGSTDDTFDTIMGLSKEYPVLRAIFQDNRGRANVRNAGARNATGDLLIFFDDDMLPETQCISVHLDHHQKHPGSILTGAQIYREKKTDSDFDKFKALKSNIWTETLLQFKDQPLDQKSIHITAANFSIPKELFFRLGGFDERLRDAEDYDFGVRTFDKGIPLYYNHEAFAWHEDPMSARRYLKRRRQYNKAQHLLLELKPELYEKKYMVRTIRNHGFKRIFFHFFASNFWIKILDGFLLAPITPKKLRYRLYDYIITANCVYFPEKVKL